MGAIIGHAPDDAEYVPIGGTRLDACLHGDHIWLRGPCGAVHTMTHTELRKFGEWLQLIDAMHEGAT